MLFAFLILYFTNLVLDFSLQDEFLKQHKSKSNYVLFVHCAIWGIGLSIALAAFGMFAWWKLIMLVGGHYIIDYWKCREIYKKWPVKHSHTNEWGDIYFDDKPTPIISDWGSLYIDQFLHVVQLILCFL